MKHINTCQLLKSMLLIFLFTMLVSCQKSFLDAKPSTSIVVPKTLGDFQQLLDNTINKTSSLPLLSCDDYYILSGEDYLSSTPTERGTYIWDKNPYGDELVRPDWNQPYLSVFYANSVLQGLNEMKQISDPQTYNSIQGQAYFIRAFAFFDLLKSFSPAYSSPSATTDLGIPLRLSPNVDEIVPRATVQQSYDQVIKDLNQSLKLLSAALPPGRNRASKPAAYALFARLYLSMRDYAKAELNADSCLSASDQLVDYNTIDPSSSIPFDNNNPENLFWAIQTAGLSNIAVYNIYSNAGIVPELLDSYQEHDLRKKLYFNAPDDFGLVKPKRNYAGATDAPFTGLATDEIYLIKAECAARRNDPGTAMRYLNALLLKRFETGTYTEKAASSPAEALAVVLLERRKELVWRAGLRWDDLRRLNREGANLSLTRIINGTTYTLPPNDPRYVFPIPQEEISLSDLQQNQR